MTPNSEDDFDREFQDLLRRAIRADPLPDCTKRMEAVARECAQIVAARQGSTQSPSPVPVPPAIKPTPSRRGRSWGRWSVAASLLVVGSLLVLSAGGRWFGHGGPENGQVRGGGLG